MFIDTVDLMPWKVLPLTALIVVDGELIITLDDELIELDDIMEGVTADPTSVMVCMAMESTVFWIIAELFSSILVVSCCRPPSGTGVLISGPGAG